MVVAFHPTIHNGRISLLSNALSCHLVIDPIRISPHRRIDLAKLNGSRGVVGDSFPELVVKVSIVQEHVGVVPETVEVPLNRFDRLYNTIQFLVSGKDDKSSVGSGPTGIDLETARGEDFIMLLADFSVWWREVSLA